VTVPPPAPGTPTVTVDRSWFSFAGVHGGHLAALGLAAMRELVPDRLHVRTVTVHFLAPVDDRPVAFRPRLERHGRGSAFGSFTAEQAGRSVLTGSAVFGAARTGPGYDGVPPLAVPAPHDCPEVHLPHELAAFSQYLELRAALPVVPLDGDGKRPELAFWVRFADRRPLGPEAAVLLTDALPPALFAVWTRPRPVPSVDLTVHLTDTAHLTETAHLTGPPQAGPAGWALVRITTEHAGNGWAVDASTVWTQDGDLLALGRQTRRVLGELPALAGG
jgi:acyl-CoA thioesterase